MLGIPLATVNTGIFGGSLVFGFASDKIGTGRALIFGNVLGITACILLASITLGQVLWLMVSVLLVGAFQGGSNDIALAQVHGAFPPLLLGTLCFAVYTSIGNAGMAILGSLTISIVSSLVGAA